MKSGNLNFLEPSGPFQACKGTAFTMNNVKVTTVLVYMRTCIVVHFYVTKSSRISEKNLVLLVFSNVKWTLSVPVRNLNIDFTKSQTSLSL